jgi:hypothetical protein
MIFSGLFLLLTYAWVHEADLTAYTGVEVAVYKTRPQHK